MKYNHLTPLQKKEILKAVTRGLLTKEEVMHPEFNPNLYTLTDLPVFAFKHKDGKVEFMREYITEQKYNEVIEYYKMIGNTQQVLLIDL